MTLAQQLFSISLIVGLILFGAEIFVPGGILGTIGSISLIGAMIAGFYAFPGYGGYVAMAIIFLLGVAIVLWIKLFPKTRIGKQMTVSLDLAASKATPDALKTLLGKIGAATSDLRPSGFALIDSHRVDVVTQGGMINKGTPIKVIQVEGNRVVVAPLSTNEHPAPPPPQPANP